MGASKPEVETNAQAGNPSPQAEITDGTGGERPALHTGGTSDSGRLDLEALRRRETPARRRRRLREREAEEKGGVVESLFYLAGVTYLP
ncbi:hypothetical protein Cob_v009322 [Colletotrichum orbiculare MAFF 240422]|uniref:Uncharacterized protein n=1 Tax=Colletotrichum orbiculare (strain 104-T / ATCC 96160 / CBS 514.97 / LARS 414 / MAFF 240422) TaxID=1213857 RepID=A0A484FJJ9_COLOR|nr:hypothetical protein Cob_v009322 [Colletotrichum orbiculare MAFF 240422]